MIKSDERLYITEDELVSEAKTIAIELNQMWEMQPFYLDEEKPLHQITVPHDSVMFQQFLRIPTHLLPAELQPSQLEHPPKFISVKKQQHTSQSMPMIDKKDKQQMQEDDDMKVLNFASEEEEDEGDYQADQFEDFDQDDMSDDFGGSED